MRPMAFLVLLALLACEPPDGSTPGLDGSFDYHPRDAGTVSDAGVDAGLLPFLAPCTLDTDCLSAVCFHFNAYGPHCTHSCTSNADCESPSPGCSGMGVCKLH